ncbi:TlpA family protein disulfide reductase [Labilibaculum euxinus]
MKRIVLLFCLFCWVLTTTAQEFSGTLKLQPEKLIAGKSIDITYNPAGSNFTRGKAISAAIYLYNNYHWSVEGVTLENNGEIWQAKFNLPKTCAFVALKFYQGLYENPDAFDNNNETGYKFSTLNDQGEKLPGGAIALALFDMPSLYFGLNYYQNTDKKLSNEVLSQLLKEEEKIKQSDPKYYIESYVAIQKILKGDRFKVAITRWLDKLAKDPSLNERQYLSIKNIYQFEFKDNAKADFLEKIILKKYPKGAHSRFLTFHKKMNEVSGTKQSEVNAIESYEDFLKSFPITEWKQSPQEQGYIYYQVHCYLATAYFNAKKTNSFLSLVSGLDFKTLNEVSRWNIGRAYAFKTMGLDTLESISAPIIKNLIKKVTDGSYKEEFFSKKRAESNAYVQLDNRLATYIAILFDLKQYDEALKYFENLSNKGKLGNPELNELHMRILEKTNNSKLIKPFLESCVLVNSITPKMFDKIKDLYLGQHEDLSGYDAYLTALKSSTEQEELKAEIKQNLTNKEYMPFALRGMDGKLVRSSDWEGKIVVLDFWATWCKPCINALPSMQVAVDKYANDSTVDFYFIGTMQNGDYKEKSEAFVKRKGFRLKFLHDNINPKSGAQSAVFSSFVPFFNSSAIPRKVILKDGFMRYTSEGFSGSTGKLVDEISYVIELLKAEK